MNLICKAASVGILGVLLFAVISPFAIPPLDDHLKYRETNVRVAEVKVLPIFHPVVTCRTCFALTSTQELCSKQSESYAEMSVADCQQGVGPCPVDGICDNGVCCGLSVCRAFGFIVAISSSNSCRPTCTQIINNQQCEIRTTVRYAADLDFMYRNYEDELVTLHERSTYDTLEGAQRQLSRLNTVTPRCYSKSDSQNLIDRCNLTTTVQILIVFWALGMLLILVGLFLFLHDFRRQIVKVRKEAAETTTVP